MAAWISLATLPVLGDQTNLVRNLEINLVGFEQGGTTTVKNVTKTDVNQFNLATADIVAALGAATGNNFSKQAALVVITPVHGAPPSVEVRDGANSVDVTAFFAQTSVGPMFESSTSNSKTGKANGSLYSIQEFTLQDSPDYQPLPLHYTLSGLAIENFTVPAIPGPARELSAEVSGMGDSEGNALLFRGTIRIYGQQVEVVQGGGGPNT